MNAQHRSCEEELKSVSPFSILEIQTGSLPRTGPGSMQVLSCQCCLSRRNPIHQGCHKARGPKSACKILQFGPPNQQRHSENFHAVILYSASQQFKLKGYFGTISPVWPTQDEMGCM